MEDIKVIILHTSLFSRSAESTCSWTLASLFAANSSRDRVGTGGGGGATAVVAEVVVVVELLSLDFFGCLSC